MKPMPFNTDMVRAILEDRKTVTRRVVKPQPKLPLVPTLPGGCWPGYFEEVGTSRVQRPPYRPGDILYVRETFCRQHSEKYPFVYKTSVETPAAWSWKPSIHMPREAARIFLRVTDVRVERLQESFKHSNTILYLQREGIDIGEQCRECIEAYGSPCCVDSESECGVLDDVRSMFADLWDSTIKPADRALYGWAANPWAWIIEFERCEKPGEG